MKLILLKTKDGQVLVNRDECSTVALHGESQVLRMKNGDNFYLDGDWEEVVTIFNSSCDDDPD
jgi:hypothetical protein